MPNSNFIQRFKKSRAILYLLFFMNGVVLASGFYFVIESRYETELFEAIAQKIKSDLPPRYTENEFAIKALQVSNYLQERRYLVFGDQEINGIKATIFHPSTVDLMTNNGACGSYVTVLSRILKANNINVRIGQMQVNGRDAGHMIVEAYVNNRWIVLDPTYSLYFVNQNGLPATFNEIKNNWNTYKSQTPPDYNQTFSFEGIRYTNWKKFPPFTTAVKSILDLTMGKEKSDTISIRPYLLRNYHKLSWLTFLFEIVLILYTWKVYRKYHLQLNPKSFQAD